MTPIATLLVLVQADVGGSDEPRDAGLPEPVFQRRISRSWSALLSLPGLTIPSSATMVTQTIFAPPTCAFRNFRATSAISLSGRGRTFRARCRLTTTPTTTSVQLVGQVQACLALLAFFPELFNELYALAL